MNPLLYNNKLENVLKRNIALIILMLIKQYYCYFWHLAEAQGRPCELDGRVYQHGEDFQPTCEHQCTCVDGVVGCIPLCPHRISLPDWPCSRRRLTKLPGRCCQEWVCDDDNRIAEVDPLPDAHPQKHTYLTGNELLVVAPSTSWDSSAGAPYQGRWITVKNW